VNTVKENKVENSEEQDKEGQEKAEGKVPYCSTAPSAEHARAHDDDEPCDDGRAGDIDEE
jgi:hypothetical protein